MRPKLGDGVLFLGGASGGKVSLVCWVTSKNLVKRGLKAKEIVRKIAPMVKGGGGGRDDMAQAGGKDPSRLEEAISAVAGVVGEMLP